MSDRNSNVPDLNHEPFIPQPLIFSPEAVNTMIGAEIYLSSKSDPEIVAASRTLSAQYAASLTTMSQRLLARTSEVDHLKNQISELHQTLATKDRKNKDLR